MKPFIFIGPRLIATAEIETVVFVHLMGHVAAQVQFKSGRTLDVAEEEAGALAWWASQEEVSVNATQGARARRDLEEIGVPK